MPRALQFVSDRAWDYRENELLPEIELAQPGRTAETSQVSVPPHLICANADEALSSFEL